MDDSNVKGLIVGVCLAILVGVFASLAVDTFFSDETRTISPFRGD